MPGPAAQVAANPWDMGGLDPLPLLGPNNMQVGSSEAALSVPCHPGIFQTGAKPKSAVENLLGEHSALVNLDSLVDNKKSGGGAGGAAGGPPAKNPFAEQPNPFQAAAAPKPSMNQLRGGNQVGREIDVLPSHLTILHFTAIATDWRRVAQPDDKPQHRHQSFLLVTPTQPRTE